MRSYIDFFVECVQACVCDSIDTNCSSVFECVNCFMNVDDACKLVDNYTTLSDCLWALNSTSIRKMVDWYPGGNECRYSYCTTDGPFAVSSYNKTVYWKTCNTGTVCAKRPNGLLKSYSIIAPCSNYQQNHKDAYLTVKFRQHK
jgi:hypothetical protein